MNYKPSDTMNLVHEVKKLGWHFTHWKENISINRRNVTLSLYREVDPEAWRDEYRKKQAAGVKFERRWMDGTWHFGVYDFNGPQKDYREVPQESPNVKETGVGIPEASEIRKWADRYYSLWCFVENSLPRDASSDTFDIFRGYARQVNDEIYGVTDKAKEPHAAERALWKAQREAGTNEVWEEQASDKNGCWWDLEFEPEWIPKHRYRVKPMKLTAKIVRNIPMTFREYETRLHDWEFFGTREEYIAECEKYGYFVTGKIKEVVEKPETVKFYMAMVKYPNGCVNSWVAYDKEQIITDAKHCACTIIGDIEEREV